MLGRRILVRAARYSTFEAKYRDKLLEKARKQGLSSVEELKEKLADQIAEKKKELNKIDPLKELEQYMMGSGTGSGSGIRGGQAPGSVSGSASGAASGIGKENTTPVRKPVRPVTEKPFKSLDDYLKLEKLKDLSRQEVEFLWRAKWANRDDALVAVVPFRDTFQTMYKYAVRNPLFVLPLPRDPNKTESKKDQNKTDETVPVELQYIQWHFAGPHTIHCIMTSLAEYKLRQDFATPHTTIQFHLDLSQDKDMVLMNGQVERDSNVSLQDAQLLLLNVQRFFGAMGTNSAIAKQRLKLLEDFNQGSAEFDINKLITLSQSLEN
ncbi:Protein ATP11, mitochondrial [Nakaseomyces bracarensis]|uniref:Protein ATP11, mitochondrial n=1 Tax=Nakaseomyces bracarensis TaxID=273131 RepID=A0ABR4NWQ6_9SACH